MKFEVSDTIVNPEIFINEDEYSVTISLYIKEIDNKIPVFTSNIEVISSNSKTGYEVDEQRQLVINEYINNLNS